jgi:dienelactone hydrolase
LPSTHPRPHWLGRTAATALICVIAACFAWPCVQSHLQAIAILKLLAGQPAPWIARSVSSSAVTTSEIQIPSAAGPIRARLYQPVHQPHAPAVVIFHGVHHLGMDEPRLVSFARAISACGFRVLTPELPGIMDYHVSPQDITVIGSSTRWMAQQTGHPVGVIGLSFSGGLALLTASQPEFASSFRFVFAIGAHHSLAAVAQYYRTGVTSRPDGTTFALPAHEYGPLVLEYAHLEDFIPAADTAALRPILRAHLYEDVSAEAIARTHLTPTQQAEAAMLMDAHCARMQLLLQQSEARHAGEMAALSPDGHLQHLHAAVYLLHGAGDNIIPAPEALWIAQELPPATLKIVLVSPILSHLDMDGEPQPGWRDTRHLVNLFASTIREAREH